MRFRVVAVVASVLAGLFLIVPLPGRESAQAAGVSSTTVVRGTAFPEPLTAQLSFAGCGTLAGLSAEAPRPTVGTGPDTPPAGKRSLGFDLAGGNAAGALFMRPSMGSTTVADVQVYAEGGSRGVAYAAYQEPADAGTVRVWVGRADLVARTSGWQRVDATGLLYAWTKRDLKTGAQLASGPAAVVGVKAFMAAHGGDGAGFYTIGFGCDGRPFHLDAFRVGTSGAVRTFDLEGLATTTSLGGSRDTVEPGGTVRLTGAVRDQSGARVPAATLLLEQRLPDGSWTTVFRDADAANPVDPVVVDAAAGDPQVEVAPEESTTYRFRFADRPLAEGSASQPFTVTVDGPAGEATEEPTDAPTHEPSEGPTATTAPAAPATSTTPAGPASAPAEETSPATPQETEQPAEQAGEEPTEPPSEEATEQPGTKQDQPAEDPSAAETTSAP